MLQYVYDNIINFFISSDIIECLLHKTFYILSFSDKLVKIREEKKSIFRSKKPGEPYPGKLYDPTWTSNCLAPWGAAASNCNSQTIQVCPSSSNS